MWGFQQRLGMKSLWNLALRLDSAVIPWTLYVRCTELLMFDSMLSCKLAECLKIKCWTRLTNAWFFSTSPSGDVGWIYVTKQEQQQDNIIWNTIRKILYSWNGKCLGDEEMLLLQWKIKQIIVLKKRKGKKKIWMKSDSIKKYAGVLCVYYARGFVS